MTTPVTTKRILKEIGCNKLALYKGEGYLYFIYDDIAGTGAYDCESVYTPRLNDMPVARWVEIGRDFVAKMEKVQA